MSGLREVFFIRVNLEVVVRRFRIQSSLSMSGLHTKYVDLHLKRNLNIIHIERGWIQNLGPF